MALIAEDEEAEHQASMDVDAAVAKAATAELEATETAAAAAEVSVEGDEDEGAAAERAAEAAEAVTAARAAAEAAVASAASSRASRQAERELLEQERGEAEEKLGQLLEDIAAGKDKLGEMGAVFREECRDVPGGGGSALETVVGRLTVWLPQLHPSCLPSSAHAIRDICADVVVLSPVVWFCSNVRVPSSLSLLMNKVLSLRG